MTIAVGTRIKKSYSISREAEQFVRKFRKARKIASDSEALDQILRESQLAQTRASIDAAYTAFYDAAPEGILEEESSWALFAQEQTVSLLQNSKESK